MFGQTAAGRYLLIVLIANSAEGGTWTVLTARQMTDAERRLFQAR